MEEDLDKTLTPDNGDSFDGNTTARLPRIPSEEKFRVGQSRILEMVAADAPLEEILKRLVFLIESQSPDTLCSVLLLSDDGDHIRHGAAPSLPEEYTKAIDGELIGPKKGSCGTAMYRGQRVVVTDIMQDALWDDYREMARKAGLRACWSTPILSGKGKVLGSFAMYYREPRTPTGEESVLTDVATRIAALAIERQAAREILARTQAQLAQASDAASTGKAAATVADEVNDQLKVIVAEADRCLDLLNEDKPDLVLFRQRLSSISKNAREALSTLARINPTKTN